MMTTLKLMTVLLLLTASTSLSAQPNKEKEAEKSYIEVTGTAEKEIIPDEIYIAITIRERQEGKEKITTDKQEADLKDSLRSIGVSLENLSVADASAYFTKVKWSKKDVITKTEYLLKVGDALTVGKVFEKLDNLRIVDAYITKVSHSKIEVFKKEVRIMAIKAAKEKADYLLAAIGEQAGKALVVHEVDPGYKGDSYLNVRGGRAEAYLQYKEGLSSESDKVILHFRKIKLQAGIFVKFEIK